jgi:hypothetical protein
MVMAGDLLTKQQRTLWKRAEQRGGVASMTDEELREWARACQTLMVHADTGPAKAAKARRLWRQRLSDAEAVLSEREPRS